MIRKVTIFFAGITFIALVIVQTNFAKHVKSQKGISASTLDQNGTLWAPFLEWTFENTSYNGNPFDLIASAKFVHQASGETRTTGMFYDGGSTWKFRFSGTRTGEWQFTTSSADPDLNGHTGTVTINSNNDPKITGFLTSYKNKFALQTGENGDLRGYILQVYWGAERFFFPNFAELPWDIRDYNDTSMITKIINHILERGCNTLAFIVANQWFKAGVDGYDQHNSENPDLQTFRAVETAIVTVHKLGARVHIWKWRDQQRKGTPVGVGGINGIPDKRLQRYIAARLGPLPGWTMAYGFDLEEWTNESDLRKWAEFMHQNMGWPHLLMARNFSNSTLNVVSNDNRPGANYYDDAVQTLDTDPERPHLYERRFLYTRDRWNMENTLQAFWEFAMAGGAGSSWGIYYWTGSMPDYSNPEQLRTHAQFWQNRLLLDMQRANNLTDGYCLKNPANTDFIFFKESTSSIRMNLNNLSGTQSVVAIDTKKAYSEVDLGQQSARDWTWTAPYRSDWAIAVGLFESSGIHPGIDAIPPVPPTGLQITPKTETGNNLIESNINPLRKSRRKK
ncbi:MAG: DUF5060 domain-containing protein [bacterium]